VADKTPNRLIYSGSGRYNAKPADLFWKWPIKRQTGRFILEVADKTLNRQIYSESGR
jgi:hypothetical protein